MQDELDHRRLDAYSVALDFVVLAESIVESMPPGRSSLADQLRRASVSVCLNIAEGAGEFSPAEKARFYRLARRSAMECAAALDVARVLGLVPHEQLVAGDTLITRAVSMLTKLVRNTVAR